jgi:hypothetical protein
MSTRRVLAATSLALSLFLVRPAAAGGPGGPDAVTQWNDIMVTTVAGQNPFVQSRIAAMTQLAVFDAVNAVEGGYKPYLAGLSAPRKASAAAAAIAAAHVVLKTALPAAGPSLDASRIASLGQIPDGPHKDAGVAVGEAAAAAILANRAADGATPPSFHLPTSTDAGEWQVTAGCPPAGGILEHWGRVTPFGVRSASDFRSAPPPALTSRRYARDFLEVATVGGVDSALRPAYKADVARFYNAVLAVGTWNPAVRQVVEARRGSLVDRARLFALLNMAIADGLIAVMETKYVYDFWRPQTAIQGAAIDGNPATEPDPAFVPYITAPCFPSYGSAHAAASYAARAIAEIALGDDGHAISLSTAAVPGVLLEYDAFDQITDDIDDARVYGGIHFRFDQRAGARQGRRIATWIHVHQLRPVRGH